MKTEAIKKTKETKQNKKTKVSGSIFILPCTVLIIGLSVFSIYKTLNNSLERIFIMVAGLMILIPIMPSLISFTISSLTNGFKSTNRPRLTIDNKGNIIPPKTTKESNTKANDESDIHKKTSNKTKTYKTKVCTTEGYEQLRDFIKLCSQKKVMDRECVLDLKEEIDGLLGDYRRVYKDMKFTNDFHEIYCKIKSKKLVSKDYEYLFLWLGDALELNEEGSNDYE